MLKNKLFSFLKGNWVGLMLFFVVSVLFFRSYEFGKIFGFIDFGFSFLDIEQSIKNNLYIWGEKRSFGENHFNFIFDIFEYVLYFLLLGLGFSKEFTPGLLQYITILLIPFLFFKNLKLFGNIGIGKKITNNEYWIIAFLPIFSLGFFNEQWHILFSQRYAWIISLVLFYYLNKVIFTEKGKFGLLIASFFSIFAFNLFPFFLSFHIAIFFYLIFLIIVKKTSIKKVVILYFLYSLLTFVAWFNILYLYGSIDFANSDAVKYGQDLKYYVSSNNHLDNLSRGIFHLIWQAKLGWDSSMETFPYQSVFNNPFLIFIGYIPFIFFLLLLVFYQKKENKFHGILLLFIVFFLFAIFVAKGNNKPFGDIFIYLLENINILNIYRSPANKFMPVFYTFFTFSFFILYSYNKDSIKKYIKSMLIGVYIIFSIPILYYGFYSKYAFFELPQTYYALQEYLKPYSGRILFLPERDYGKKYNFGAHVNSINFFLYKNTTFDIGQTLLSNNNVYGVSRLLKNTNFFSIKSSLNSGDIYQKGKQINSLEEIDVNSITTSLNEAKIDVIIFDNNLIGTFDEKIINQDEKNIYKFALSQLDNFQKETIENFDVYIRNDGFFGENIFNLPNDSVRKISPVKYNIALHLEDTYNLISSVSFDKGWRIYVENDEGLFSADFFVNSHNKFNGYANSWEIDADYIKNNFPKAYYKENEDGTIDVKLTLYFKPQSYFYLGLLISGTTFIILIGYLGFSYLREKRKK